MFYREAGNPATPTIVLLHGFPSSSHMFRDLIPKLSDRLHVIAPDYIGFGYSDAPNTKKFKYTFDNLAVEGAKAYQRGIPHGFTNIGNKSSRLLDTILPGQFDNYFVELAALYAAGDPSEEQTDALSRKYRIKYL